MPAVLVTGTRKSSVYLW